MAGSAIGGAVGHVAEKLIVAGMEHARPTGVEAIDAPETRQIIKEMRVEQYADLNPDLERHSWILEKNGEIGQVPGKPGLNTAQPAKLPVAERANVIADVHGHGPRSGGSLSGSQLSADIKYGFPGHDAYLDNVVPKAVFDEKNLIIFDKGVYTMDAGKVFTQDYYFSSFGQRFMTNLFTW